MSQFLQRLNPWAFGVGAILVFVGVSLWSSLEVVVQGSKSSGSYTSISFGAVLAMAGVILMVVCYVTHGD